MFNKILTSMSIIVILLLVNTAHAQTKVVVVPLAGDNVNSSAGFVADAVSSLVSFGAADTDQTVGSINLPAGSYIVNASFVVNNNSGSTETLGCSLELGGEVIDNLFDTSSFRLGANTTSGSRESITLTGGGVLATAGSVDVICRSSSTSGNYLGLSFTAIQVAALTDVSPAGKAQIRGGNTDLDMKN